LQCPFQFFAAKTLRLRTRPPAPRDRFDVLVQGTILHRALATGDFEGAFQEEVSRTRIPATYRTEAVRLELLRHYEAFREDRAFALGWERRLEEEFSFALNPRLTIRGRIDRLEIGPNNEVLVIDYKYSAGNKIRERVEEHSAGNLVQGGLYLLAAKELGFDPAGMLYCGLRNEVSWEGWHIAIPGLEAVGESRTRAGLDELMQTAAARAAETFEQIAAGRIAPRPADVRKCIWCDFRDICRVESAATVLQAGSG
jgi:ATP-dependent helicase/DNAse subunit B